MPQTIETFINFVANVLSQYKQNKLQTPTSQT